MIKEADLTNNCPECFNQELKLRFYQKHLISRLFNRTTSEVSHEIKCLTCGSVIYPVSWTEDLERSFEYFQKLTVPESSKVRLTKLSVWLLVLLAVLGCGFAYLYLSGFLTDWL